MKKIPVYLLLLLVSLVFLFDPVRSFAQQDSTNLINGLSYEVLYPENQKEKDLGYFDLQMEPGQEQTVALKLYNSLSKELTVQVSLNTAKTNSIGKVEYGPNNLKADSSLTNDFINIVKGPQKVVVPPNSSKKVDVSIGLPKTASKGLIAGGIQLKPVNETKANNQGGKDTVINEFAFLIGVLVRVGDTSKIQPELKLNKTYIAFKDGKSHLFANISNIHPVYTEGMSIVVQVRKANKQKNLFEYRKDKMRMAPNSIIDFPIELADKGITAGKYTAQINISSKNAAHWSWTEDFTINTLEANSLITTRVEKRATGKLFFGFLFFILLLGLFIVRVVYKRIKSKKI
ncbi:DUF916 and DUF3324 domain-containing protein [Enterococcus caccae]|uniref:Uncharacterized protein n=1 Tax=Enterococcus caccae ATCC BAA-1240 TaxID=1158612 RepID=R3WET4_9ENTE|nr:DUF916 and DUF3324 domain-containing protein [Enterococcus caccae]EOL46371.1 hypothetical protein UC7_01338 [Enterococcus caccae ATCC BAA-1240]EOT60740.1 hypothetical protein I580_01640 [Enterococcus caccae ATCC BAA-1240]OJG27450.1 hypothetical protein RU98_GL002539 [Enterococcus caccae]